MEEEFHKIGQIAKLYRVHGKVIVLFDTLSAPEVQEHFSFLFLPMIKKPVPFYMEESQVEDEQALIVKFEDIDSRDQARPLIQKDVYLPQSRLKQIKEPSHFVTLLQGYKVIDPQQGEIGNIEEVQSLPQQYLAKIIYQDKEVLLPLNDDTIDNIDEEQEILYYNTPDGLLDL